MAEDFTAKFKVDISDLKKNITEANKQIKLANATFKSETAGMGQWSKDADGLSKKLEQLKTVLASQKSVLAAYKEELNRTQKASDENGKKAEALKAKLAELAANGVAKTDAEYVKYQNALRSVLKEQDSNAKSCEDLKLKILEQEGAVKETESAINHYSTSLKSLEKESNSLSATVDKQEKELADLKKQYVDVAASQGKDSAEAKALASQIGKLSGELKTNKTALSDAEREADKLDRSFEETGKSAEKAGEGFTVAKGVLSNLVASGIKLAANALRDLARASADAWKSFDTGRDTVIKLTGATGQDAAALKTVYSSVSKKIVADSQAVGNAVGEVSTRFGLSGEALENLSLKYLKFAEINNSDVKSSIDDTQKAMAAYGLSADNASGFLDILTKTSQTTGVNTSSLASGIVSNATAFQELGLSVEQAVLFMGQMEKSGANSETVLNGMRKALKNSAKDGKDLSTALIELQQKIEASGDGVEGLNAAYELFGKSGDQIYGAIKNGSLSFFDLALAAENAAGTVESTFNETKDATDEFLLNLQNLKIKVAETIDEILQGNGDEVLKRIPGKIQSILPQVTDAVMNIIGGINDILPQLTTAIISELPRALNALLDLLPQANEAGIQIILAIAKGISNALPQLLPKAVEIILEITQGILDHLDELLYAAVDIIVALAQGLINATPVLIEKLPEIITSIVMFLSDPTNLVKLVAAAIMIIMAINEGIIKSIPALIKGVAKIPVKMYEKLKESVSNFKDIGRQLLEGLWNGINDKVAWLKGKVKGVVDKIKSWFTGKDGFDEHSPSKWSEAVGEYIGEGLTIGIEKSSDAALKALTDLVTDSKDEAKNAMDATTKVLLDSERLYNQELERLKDSKSEADKAYIEGLKSKAEEERKIYDAEIKDAENAKKQIVDVFNDISKQVFSDIENLQKIQEDFAKKLDDSIVLFKTNTISIGDATETWYSVADLPKQTKQLEDFYDLLMQVKNRGNIPTEFFSMLRDMSIEEATKASKALLSLSDSEFNAYFENWKHLREVEAKIAKDVYADEAADIVRTINEQFEGIASNFLSIGESSADEFEDGFTAKLRTVLQNIRQQINAALGSIINIPESSFSIDTAALRSAAGSMLGSVQPQTASAGSVKNEKTTTFTQNIYAPEQPSRIELYRQTKNLLALAESGV